MDKLRKRFITFNMVVIGCIMIAMAILIYFGSPTRIPLPRLMGIVIITLFLALLGSVLLSKIALKPIKAAWQKQLDFTADASHELRTPLAVMRTNLELVMDNAGETVESQKKWLENIHAENIRMAKLVDALLTLSRSDAEAQSLEFTSFMLDELAKDIITVFETTADSKSVSLLATANEKISFYGDKSRIRQLLIILVDNALKYIDKPGSVELSLRQKENSVQIVVSDTGVGIAPEHLDKIFNRFYRIEKTRKQNQDGSGLGLSIAEWIVHEHGGNIRVESVLGKGTRFIVSLPVKMQTK